MSTNPNQGSNPMFGSASAGSQGSQPGRCRRLVTAVADWTRTMMILVACIVALVAAVSLAYLAVRIMIWFVQLAQCALGF